MENFVNFFINSYKDFAYNFGNIWSWLTTNNNVLGIAPLSIVGFGGITILFAFLVIKVVI